MDWNWVYGVALVAVNNLVLYVWKPWAGAYSGEKGKNLARKEDLTEILAEVRAVTATQKDIEAKISGELWTKQMVWNQRRDLYGRILDVLRRLSEILSDKPWGDATLEKKEEFITVLRDVHHLWSLASIFANKRCREALGEIFELNALPDDPSTYSGRVSHAQVCILVAAQEDLGIEPEP